MAAKKGWRRPARKPDKPGARNGPAPPPDWVPAFVAALAASPNVSAAAKAAGIARSVAYERRDSDAGFAAAWDDALDQSTDALVGEMYRRAVEGVGKPVFYRGEMCGAWVDAAGEQVPADTVGARFSPVFLREFSDTLAIFLARAHRPRVYREKVDLSADVTVRRGGDLARLSSIELESLGIIAARLADERPEGAAEGR